MSADGYSISRPKNILKKMSSVPWRPSGDHEGLQVDTNLFFILVSGTSLFFCLKICVFDLLFTSSKHLAKIISIPKIISWTFMVFLMIFWNLLSLAISLVFDLLKFRLKSGQLCLCSGWLVAFQFAQSHLHFSILFFELSSSWFGRFRFRLFKSKLGWKFVDLTV